jgi:hypothetical protein
MNAKIPAVRILPTADRKRWPDGRCHVWLDCATGAFWFQYSDRGFVGALASAYQGRTRRWRAPALWGAAARDLLEILVPLAERVCAGYSAHHDGSDRLGTLYADARLASGEIADALERAINAENCR